MRSTRILLTGIALGIVVSACGAPGVTPKVTPSTAPRGPGVTIGSPSVPEQVIVANLYAGVLEHGGAKVTLRTDLGTRAAVEPALASGQLDLYPDYAGTLLLFLDSNDTQAATQTSTAIPNLKHLLGIAGATVLDPAPALDTDVFAVTRASAAQYHLTTLSSLSSVAGQLVLGGPPGCSTQPQCLVGLQNTYGLRFKSFTSLDDEGPITVSALVGGEVQVAELSSSDGTIVRNDFVALDDDKHLMPADYVIPVIRKSVDTPKVAVALNRLSAKLTTTELARLNIAVTADHGDPRSVARQWLRQKHLI